MKPLMGLSSFTEKDIDSDLQKAQWAAWRASRRRFLGAGFAAAGGLALAGLSGARLVTPAAAQEGETMVTAAEAASKLASLWIVAVDGGRAACGEPVHGSR